ncbi:glycosyltransferase family 2 protein [Planomonospora sp. ID82291]|uniref:glycosyltransferase family 2 protein n=1 Tax=Planomonospora sp. ID82291 TaxID=2738136 RepID=UPI0018C3752C|nr:glycosyltransferase family 2 protein [Planomonospora sp. ID82291]MBG0815028.1 glycosyltransferase family 2 protein [Planomonospora sp. ID82291]
MGVKVSVVVPVRDPGDTANACIHSAVEQSMSPEEFEVIFADDGSDDGTRQRLAMVAAAWPNVRVLHLPPTGSPMRGRNAALEVAKGEYVYLMGQTDRLERTALERMYERATATGADILVGRLEGGDGPPPRAFDADREHADILTDGLLSLLTPHKLYRRAFLAAERLTFPEPGGILSEQAFAVRAYLRAGNITVMAGEVCCHLGERPEPPVAPAVQAAELRALLDAVDEAVPDGRRRDRMYAHWFRTAILPQLGGDVFSLSSRERSATFTALRELVLARFPERLDDRLPVHLRMRAALLRAGRPDQLVMLSQATRETHLKADLKELAWNGGVLELGIAMELMWTGDTPTCFVPHGDRLVWKPPIPLEGLGSLERVADVTEAVAAAGFDAYLRHRDTGMVHMLPVTCSVLRLPHRDRMRVQITGTASFDVTATFLGQPLPSGFWEIHVRMYGGPHRARARVTGEPFEHSGALADYPGRPVVPWWCDEGLPGVCVEPRLLSDAIALVSQDATSVRRRDHVFFVVPVPYLPEGGGPPGELVLRRAGGRREISVPALVEPGEPGMIGGSLVAKVPTRRLPQRDLLVPGRWTPFLRMDGQEVGLRFRVRMSRFGGVEVHPAAAARLPERRYPLLRRIAVRIPGVRNMMRFTRTLQRRYLPG